VEVKKMIMSEKEKSNVWAELVKSSDKKMGVVRKEKRDWRKERVGWRKELVSDLKLLVMVEVVGCGLFVIIEVLKY